MDAQTRVWRHLRTAQSWEFIDHRVTRVVGFILVVLLIAGVGQFVYVTGGIKYVYSHAMYLPVVLAGLVFRASGGVLAGMVAGMVLGPYMPIDTVSGELQQPVNWLYRTLFLCLAGGFSGLLFAVMSEQIKRTLWVSERDAHTGLPNRMFLERRLRNWQRRRAIDPESIIVVINVDNYLEIINTLGHDLSTPLMKAIFERIKSCLPPHSLLCQYHTDRFVAVANSAGMPGDVQNITAVLRRSFNVNNVHVYADTSLGIAQSPLHGLTLEELIHKASIAMHASMKKGRPYSIYNNKIDHANRETLTLLGLIPNALANGEFSLYCQPKLRLSDRVFSGAEMLMRWRHPERGDIPPGHFIPFAERTSLIHLLTRWALEESMRHLTRWKTELPDIQVSVNLTARDLSDPELPQLIDRLARQYALKPRSIEFEITETGILSDEKSAAEVLQVIKSYGFRIAIDDFGTGQSSLRYLKNLPIDNLKIDRTFVSNLLTDRRDQAIVNAVIAMAKSLDLEITAEGIEDPAAIEYLAAHGCTHAQGYAIARPFPADQLAAWVRSGATT